MTKEQDVSDIKTFVRVLKAMADQYRWNLVADTSELVGKLSGEMTRDESHFLKVVEEFIQIINQIKMTSSTSNLGLMGAGRKMQIIFHYDLGPMIYESSQPSIHAFYRVAQAAESLGWKLETLSSEAPMVSRFSCADSTISS